jgi:hypothetical protein
MEGLTTEAKHRLKASRAKSKNLSLITFCISNSNAPAREISNVVAKGLHPENIAPFVCSQRRENKDETRRRKNQRNQRQNKKNSHLAFLALFHFSGHNSAA